MRLLDKKEIGNIVVGGVILAIVLGIGTTIISNIKKVNWFDIISYKVPLYLLLISIIVLLCCIAVIFYVSKKLPKEGDRVNDLVSNSINSCDEINLPSPTNGWLDFKRRPYKNIIVKWNYDRNGDVDRYTIKPCCSECGCELSWDDEFDSSMTCPNPDCEKSYDDIIPYHWMERRNDIKKIIENDIETGEFRKWIKKMQTPPTIYI